MVDEEKSGEIDFAKFVVFILVFFSLEFASRIVDFAKRKKCTIKRTEETIISGRKTATAQHSMS